ncbi:hypothetical protein KFE94_00780 [bacterium SCSIO 12643]|nr:hypothetical protein KFE94_00780 [bacterium SCSIO 12643]
MIEHSLLRETEIFISERNDWMVFKTNIQTSFQVDVLKLLFQEHTDVKEWTIDLEDEDRVLRIKSGTLLKVEELISLGGMFGFQIQMME